MVSVSPESAALLLKPDVARGQLDAEVKQVDRGGGDAGTGAGSTDGNGATTLGSGTGATAGGPTLPRRFHGSVTLDTARVGRDAGRIAEEVIAHLSGLVGADVKVTLEIHADVPSGAPDNVVRTVTENCRTLKFSDQGFEKE